MTLAEINAMAAADFIARFGDVAEHSPWVAEAAEKQRPFAGRGALIAAFAAALDEAPEPARLALIRAHPDLAGKAAVAGDLTVDSRREQAGAGLASLTPVEFARFTRLNTAYRARFGFPFILAVKGASKEHILSAFEQRLKHAPGEEMKTALAQVKHILRFRLEDRVAP